jgi:hypothetical protein
MIDDDFVKEIYKGLDFDKMKKRNQQITEHIRQLLKTNPQKKYSFVVGVGQSFIFYVNKSISIFIAHLFGNISIVQMLQNDDYYIEQIDSPSPNFSYQYICFTIFQNFEIFIF